MNFILKLVRHNLGLKMLSVLIAVLLWLFVRVEQYSKIAAPTVTQRQFKHVPVAIIGDDQKYQLLPKYVHVKVTGPEAEILALKPREILAQIQLLEKIDHDALLPVEVELPPGITLLEVSPTQILVQP